MNAFKKLVSSRGLTYGQVAKKVGVAVQTVSLLASKGQGSDKLIEDCMAAAASLTPRNLARGPSRRESYPSNVDPLLILIDQMRVNQGLRVSEFCRRVGVTAPAYANWMAGRACPNLQFVSYMVTALGYSLDLRKL